VPFYFSNPQGDRDRPRRLLSPSIRKDGDGKWEIALRDVEDVRRQPGRGPSFVNDETPA